MNPARLGAKMLSKTQLSAYLSRCPRKAELAYRLKYCLDDGVRDELRRLLILFSADIAAKEGWPVERGQHYLEKMANLAMDELRNPLSGDNWQVRAKALGLKKRDWEAVWRSKYAIVWAELNDWGNIAFRQVWRMQE